MSLLERLFGKKPERRVFKRSTGAESFYSKMSHDLAGIHGPLVRAEYVDHFPTFRIRFIYEDGTVVRSDERTGRYDIHFLSLGYVGEGPRYAKAFLLAAGIDLTTNEIKRIKPGDVVTADSASEERFASSGPVPSPLSDRDPADRYEVGLPEQLSDRVQARYPPVLSSDGSLVAILRSDGQSSTTVDMVSTTTHSIRWSTQLPFLDCEAAFISADMLLLLGESSDSEALIQLVELSDGSILDKAVVPTLARTATGMGWVSGKRVHSDTSLNVAVREVEGDQILLIRASSSGELQLSRTKVSQINGEGPRIGPDGQCYVFFGCALHRLTEVGPEEVLPAGDHCICFDQGRVYLGSGFGDMSGESYLHVVDLRSKQSRSIVLGREPIHRLSVAGEDRVLACSIVEGSEFRNRHHAYVAALDVSGHKGRVLWDRRIEHLESGHVPVVLTAAEESWGLLQVVDRLLLVSLESGDVLGELPKRYDEMVLGVWARSPRRMYLARFPGWNQPGIVESVRVEQR